MDLVFEKEGNKFVARFKAEGNFNLHLEKERGTVNVYQTTVEGANEDNVEGMAIAPYHKYFDSDFPALVYPKWIKVVAEEMPTMAVVTFAK